MTRGAAKTAMQILVESGVEREHSERVAENALFLFDSLRDIIRLDETYRGTIEAAGLLHDIGYCNGARDHHVLSRDIILSSRIKGFSARETRIIAWAAYLHGGWFKKDRFKETLAEMHGGLKSSEDESAVLKLGSILRLADGLDYSRLHTRIESIKTDPGCFTIDLSGPGSATDAARAAKKSDLWKRACGEKIVFCNLEMPSALKENLPKQPGIEPDDTMAEAARKLLLFYMAHMEANDAGTLEGRDIEALHDMRVAAMRMRAIFEVFYLYLDRKKTKPLLKGLKKLRKILGTVRDLDVLLEDADGYVKMGAGKADLIQGLRALREEARVGLREHLLGQEYTEFKCSLTEALGEDRWASEFSSDAGRCWRVSDAVPHLLYRELGCVRSFNIHFESSEGVSLETLHGIRIAFKILRYTLEFFREILGPEQKKMVAQLKGIQNHLGLINDGVVALRILKSAKPSGWQGYARHRKIVLKNMVRDFPPLWDGFMGRVFNVKLAASITPLYHQKQ